MKALRFKHAILLVLLVSLLPVITNQYPLGEDTWYHYAMIKQMPNVYEKPWGFEDTNIQPPLVYAIMWPMMLAGLDMLLVFRLLPIFIALLFTCCAYLLAKHFLKSEEKASFAALLAALAPGSYLFYPFPKYIGMALLCLALYLFLKRDNKAGLLLALIGWTCILEFAFAIGSVALAGIFSKRTKEAAFAVFTSLVLVSPWYGPALLKASVSGMALLTAAILPHRLIFFNGAALLFIGFYGLFRSKDNFLRVWFSLSFVFSMLYFFGIHLVSSRFLSLSIVPLSILASGIFFSEIRKAIKSRKFYYGVIAIVVVTAAFAFTDPVASLDHDKYHAAMWLQDNAPKNSTLASDEATMNKMHALTGIRIPDINEARHDLFLLFSTEDRGLKRSILEKYDVDYVLVEKDRTFSWTRSHGYFLFMEKCRDSGTFYAECYLRLSDYRKTFTDEKIRKNMDLSFMGPIYENEKVIIYSYKKEKPCPCQS